MDINFFFEVLIGGLLSGVMYALVAIGFVLIYKASGVFNFAQGAMVFFAALTCVGLMDKFGLSLWLAIPATIVVMVMLGFAIERVVLRPLVNQPEITLFMATIGLAFFIEGLAQLMWGSQVHRLELPIEDVPLQYLMDKFNIVVSQFDVMAAAICGVLVIALALMFT
jgi:branched-chain amino acid transport system permease protein